MDNVCAFAAYLCAVCVVMWSFALVCVSVSEVVCSWMSVLEWVWDPVDLANRFLSKSCMRDVLTACSHLSWLLRSRNGLLWASLAPIGPFVPILAKSSNFAKLRSESPNTSLHATKYVFGAMGACNSVSATPLSWVLSRVLFSVLALYCCAKTLQVFRSIISLCSFSASSCPFLVRFVLPDTPQHALSVCACPLCACRAHMSIPTLTLRLSISIHPCHEHHCRCLS